MIRVTDRIKGASRATWQDVYTWAERNGAKRLPELREFLIELERLCRLYGYDFAILAAQSALETGNWTDNDWVDRLNPGGIGVFPSGPSAPFVVRNGKESAAAMLSHAHAYVDGPQSTNKLPADIIAKDPRYDAVGDKGWFGTVTTLADYVPGKWATATGYGQKIAQRGNAMMPNVLDQGANQMAELEFGNVKHPAFQDRLIPNNQNGAWDDLGQRQAIGVCQHSMVGTLMGTDGWFRRGAASNGLTDYGIGNTSDGAALDGVIFRWNDPRGRRSGWANGGSDGLEGDGILYVRKLGVNAINRDLVSIERSDGGNTNSAMSAKQFTSIVSLTAYWMDQAKVPWDQFPFNPAKGIVCHLLHFEFATKTCPHNPVVSRINDIQNAVRGILKAAQTQTDGKPIPPPKPIETNLGEYPNGWDVKDLRKHMGPLRRETSGSTAERKAIQFGLRDAVSNAIVARAVEEGITRIRDIPKWRVITDIRADADQAASLIVFNGVGAESWALYRANVNMVWRWVK